MCAGFAGLGARGSLADVVMPGSRMRENLGEFPAYDVLEAGARVVVVDVEFYFYGRQITGARCVLQVVFGHRLGAVVAVAPVVARVVVDQLNSYGSRASS